MVDLSNLQNVPLKIITLIHFILTTWGTQGDWSSHAYLYYNIIFLLVLFWGIHQKDSPEPIQIALAINLLSILFDVIILAAYFPSSFRSSERFSVGMAILNLVFRPLTSFGLYRILQDRDVAIGGGGSSFPGNFGDIFGGSGGAQRSPYEDIDGSPARGATAGNSAAMFPEPKSAPSYHG